MAQDNIKNLYDALKGDYDLGSEDDFRNSLKDANNRRNLYKAIEGDYDLGSEQDFEKSLGYGGNEERTGNAGRTENTESHTQQQSFTQEEYGRLSPTAQEVAQGVGIAPNNGTDKPTEPNEADLQRVQEGMQRVQAREPKAQFVPEASNIVMATPTAETLKRYPWLKADEAVPFNRETGEPLYTWTDEQGRPISRSEIGIRTAKQEITGEHEYMQQQPASLELPDSNARAMRLDGSLTEYVDVLMKEKYGDDYLNGTFTTADGRQVSGSELMTETAQQQYNELNNDINNARIEYLDAGEGQRKELVDALSKKYQGLLTRESIERTMNDEQTQIEAREIRRQRERQQIDEAYNKAYTDRAAVMQENARKAQEEYNNSSWLSRMFGGNPVQRAYWMNQSDKRIQIADTQINIALDARRVLDTGKAYDDGESWGGRLVRGMRDAMTDTGLYDGGVEEMHDLRNVKEAVDAYEAGTATDAQKDLLDTYSLLTMVNGENADALGGMYGAGQMTIQAIPFMAQMYINPIGSLGQSTMKAATRYGLKTFGRSTMNRYMKRLLTTSLKAGGRVTGDMLAAALPAMTFGAPAIGADMYDRLIGNARGIRNKQGNIEYSGRDNAETSKAAAIAKSIGSNYLKYQSEMVSEYFRPLSNIISRGFGRATDKLGLGKVRDMIANISNKDFYRAYADFARRTQWQGTFNEYLEEVVNNVENALFIGDMDFSTDENGVFNLDTNIDTFLGVTVMSGYMSSLKTVDYIRTKGRLKDALDNAYTSGLDVFGTNEWQRITDEIDGLDDKTAASAVKKMLNNVDSDEKKRTIINYATAALANQGFNAGELKNSLEQVSDAAVNGGVPQDAIPGIENLAPEERQNVHVDGMIHAAVLYPTAENGQPQEVFITRGNVVMREDGTIDTDASDKEIYYKGADGQVHLTSPDKLQAVAEPISVENYVAANRPKEADEPDMAEEIVPGQVVNINVDGQTFQATVQGTDGNGNVSVYYQDANGMDRPATFTIDEIRNANRPNNEEPPAGGAGAVVESVESNGANEPNAPQTAEDIKPIDVSEYFGNAEEAMETAKDIIQNGEVIGTLPDGSVQMQKDGFVVTLMPDGNGGMNVTGIERTGNNTPQNIPENGNIGAKNIQQTDGISTENGGISAENIQQEQQIPQDDEGNLIYDYVPVEATIADLYDGSLNDDEVQGFIDANINEAQKKYDSVQKKAPKIGTNKAKYLEQKRKWQADVDEAKRVLDYWNEVNSQKQALTHTTEEETQAAQAELSGQNAREEFNQYNENGVNDAVSVASDFIRGAKITPESFRAETGYGTGEQRRFVGMIASEQNGGKSIDRLAEELVSYDNAELNGVTFNGDTSAAKDAILEALQSAGTRGELTTDNTAEQERYVEARRAELDAQCMEAYGMTYEDYLAYEEQILPEMLRKYANFDEVEFYNLYADEIEQSLNARINEQGNDTAGEEPRTGGGNEVLPEQGIGNAGGSEGGTEQGTEVPAGVQGTVEDGAVPEETNRGEDKEYQLSETDTQSEQVKQDNIRTIDPRSMSNDERQQRGDMLRNAPAIEVKAGQIVSTPELSARKVAERWWDENVPEPVFYDTEVGEVEINKNSVESSLAHRYGQAKLDAITSLVDGFENAVYLGTLPDFTRQEGVLSHYFAYPIIYNDKRCYVFCRAMQDANKNRLYVHEVFVAENIKRGDTLQTAASQPHGGIALYKDILGNVLEEAPEQQSLLDGNNPHQYPANRELSESKDTQTSANEQRVGEKIAQEEAKVEQNPTEAQKEAGNYKKGHVKIDGYDVTIENPKGSVRSGVDRNGQEWSVTMNNTYGYIRGTEGVDGDHIDVFLSDDPTQGDVYVIDQVNENGSFDEHKVMYGFKSALAAKRAYLANYSPGWKGLGTITKVSKEEFKKWINSSHRKTKPFAEYKSVNGTDESAGKTGRTERTGKAARIEKLRNSKPVMATGEEYKGKYELNNKAAADYINKHLKGEYVNKDTGTPIKITRKGAFKVTRHDAENEAHLKSVALIPQMIENAIFIHEEQNDKGNNKFDSYRYYVTGLNMGGVDYTVKLTVGVKNGETYYDHALTEIEKSNLIDRIDEISSSFTGNKAAPISKSKDKRLISILQTNDGENENNGRTGSSGKAGNKIEMKGLTDEAHELFSGIIAQSTHNIEINDSGVSETDNTLYAPIKVDGKDTSLSLYQEEPAHSSEEPIVGVSFYRDGMTYQEAADLSDAYNQYVGERVCADGSDELAINFGSIDEAVRFEEWLNDNRGVRFREADNEISDFAQKHNLNEKDVQDYADYMRQGNLNGASGAFHDIRRKIRIDNKGVSLGQFAKIFSPIRKELYEKFGNIDEMREQYVQHELEERSVMEAARKRAEEAAEAERRRLQEFQDMSDEQLDDEYMKAVEANDENRMRDLVNEAARRNGYGDVDSEYQGVGAWSAPSNPGYESDEERRAALETDGNDVNVVDMAQGYTPQPDDYFTNLRAYGNDTPHGRESAEAINKAMDEARKGKDQMIKVYRAVPKSVKEGKLRNGDWVTPSRKYAEMHGDNRLEGDYRIIEQEVPASQLWWDGNDINEWGFDDGKGYAYRNTKNNRKLNDLITRDDKGNIIPLSQRFNARKADVRYRFIGEQGAARLDAAEEATTRLDNLSTARQMEQAYNDKKARIDKLRDSKPVEITGEEYKGKYDLNRDSAQDFILKNLRGEYTIADTGEKVTISKVGAKKVTSHSMGNNAHLKSIFAIPQLLENAIFIEETPNEKSNGKYDSYRYYVVGLKIGNEDYTARITIGVKNGEYYYDHYLTEIEKGNLIEIANGFIPTGDAPVPSYTKSKDTRLISLLQTNDQENARKIKLATGWERGADGKWKYETPDFEYHPNGDARQNDKYKESDWYKELYDLEERLFNGETLTDEETRRFDELAARENEIRDNDKNTEHVYLDDYVKDDELFKAYPELKQTRVDFVDLPNEEYSAKYNSEENRITVNQAKSMDVKSVLAHEIQHVIQRIEGFASGSNTDNYRNAATSENVIAEINAATGGRLVESGGFNNTPEGIFDALNRKTTYGTILRDNSTELDEVARKYGYETIFDLVNDIGKFKSSVEMYRSEAGEVEARNVQERLNMTPEQRRNMLAEETEDVAREDQQFLQDAIGTGESLASTVQSDDIDAAVADTANKLNIGVRVAHSVDEVSDEGVRRAIEKGRNVKGWYDTRTGEIVVYAPNATDADDAVRTVLHEGVAHYGLRQLVGDENFDTFLDNIYNNVDEGIKAAIDEKAQRHGWSTRVATEEYLASLAEDTNFEAARSSGLWQRIKDFFMDLLTKAGVRLNEALTDNELRYILWRSYENLAEPGRYRSIIGEVRDIAKQHELNVGNYSSDTDVRSMSAENDDIRYREADEAEDDLDHEWQDEYDRRTLSAAFKFTEAAQDGMKSVSILQDIISKETGKPIKENENVWALQNRLSSTNKYEQDYFYENFYKPLMRTVGNLVKAGARYDELGRNMEDAQDDILKYLISKHGIERNAHFREVAAMEARQPYEESIEKIRKAVEEGEITRENADKQIEKLTEQANGAEEKSRIDTITRDYSGLSELYNNKMDFDALAEQYVSDFESKFDTADLWNKINAATKMTLRKTYEAGLISRSGYEATRDMYQYYIPLRGWSNDVASEMYNYKGQQGVGGRIMKRAKGRKSLAENPLAVIGRMGQDGILQANKNRVKQRLYNLAIGHDTSLLSISKQWYVNEGTKENPDWQRAYPELSGDMGADEVATALKEFDEKMKALKDEGMATQRRDGLTLKYHTTTAQEQQHRVNVSIGGREYNIYVNGNPRAAQAINGELRMDDEGNSIIQRVNRWLANVYTSLNPEFVVTNYERDAGFAAAIVAATETPAYQAGWIKNMAKFNPITTGVYINSLIKKSMKAEDRTNEADEATAITEANRRFNEQLARLTEENADRITLWLGRPSAVLRAAGVEDKPMKLYGSKVMKKMRKHGFTLNELKDLPRAVADPIAVFDNYGKDGNRAILTELKTKQGNFLVTLNIGKGEDIDFNIVSSVFGKNEDNIVDWIEKGFATYIDKEKALNYLHHSALRAEALSSPRLISAANIVRNFENPKTNGENEREKSKYERYMREFLANGGETGFTNMLTADDYKKLIKKEIKEVNKPITASKAGRVCFGWAQRANRVFEDATRFATYVTSREQGRSIDWAIRDAKEISLNFNTRGADGMKGDGIIYKFFRNLRHWFIFTNPSIQGLNKAGVAFSNHPVRSTLVIAGLPAILGYGVAALASSILDGDDDEKVREAYMDLPKWIRRTNICIPIGGTKFITIPLSYELRVAYGMGEMFWEIEQGMIEPGELVKETVTQLSDLMPLSFASGTVAQNLSPTIVRPLIDIIQNKDFTGRPIYRENTFNQGMPEYTKAYAGTAKWLTKSSEVLNNAMPKFWVKDYPEPDKYTPGAINVNPAIVEHLLDSYLGGLYTFPAKVAKTVSMVWDEDMRDVRNIPFVNRNVKDSQSGNPITKSAGDRYNTYMKEYRLSKQRWDGYRRETNHGVTEFVPKLMKFTNSVQGQRMFIIDGYKKSLDELDKQVKDMDEYEGYGEDEERKRLKQLSNDLKQELVNRLDSVSMRR